MSGHGRTGQQNAETGVCRKPSARTDQPGVTRSAVNTLLGGPDLKGVNTDWLEAPMSPMTLLENGIPLSLLLDLMCGPQSADLLDQERAAAE